MKTTLISMVFSSFIFVSGAGFVPRNVKMPFLLRSFIGINLCCLVAIPILYFNAKMINILIPSLIVIGYTFIIKHYFISARKFTYKRIFNNKNIFSLGAFSFVFALMILSFLDFFPTEYIYSEHDLLYWSWSTNFHEIDYSGTIRSEIAWPMQFTSYHLLSGMLPGYLNYFGPLQNLAGIILIKFLVMTLVVTLILTDIVMKRRLKIMHYILSFAIPFLIFRQEIAYSMLISNYLAVLIMFMIFWLMFQSKSSDKNAAIAILFFIISFSKFVLFPIGILLFFMYYNKKNSQKYRIFSMFLILLSTANTFVWLFVNKPKDSASIDFYNPLHPDYLVNSLKFVNWIVDPLLKSITNSDYKYVLTGFALAVTIGKIFLIFGLSYKKLTNYLLGGFNKTDSNFYLFSWFLFMFYSILGCIFLRVGTLDIKHSAQLLFFSSIVTFVFVGMYLSELKFSKFQYIAISASLVFTSLLSPYKINDGFSLLSPMRSLTQGSIRSVSFEGDKFNQINLIDTHAQTQLKASIKNSRVTCSTQENDRLNSPIYLFLFLNSGETC
jgi:hypothetical protein